MAYVIYVILAAGDLRNFAEFGGIWPFGRKLVILHLVKKLLSISLAALALLGACGSKSDKDSATAQAAADSPAPLADAPAFSADSAYSFVERQVAYGPRVPGSEAHTRTAQWLASQLRGRGAETTVQEADLKAFDGTVLHARNIFGRFAPENPRRVLLLAHWDSRPWADNDPDPANHTKPVPGANDGASGVGVLLEMARLLQQKQPAVGVDILFVDAEDYGTDGDDLSWALGARHFVENPPVEGYAPEAVVLLDMVGGKDARFAREQFSAYYAPGLLNSVWAAAERVGESARFTNEIGGMITDDHREFQNAGLQAIDIIEYCPDTGFNPRWHTLADDMSGISAETLGAVGRVVTEWLYSQK